MAEIDAEELTEIKKRARREGKNEALIEYEGAIDEAMEYVLVTIRNLKRGDGSDPGVGAKVPEALRTNEVRSLFRDVEAEFHRMRGAL